MIRLLITTVFVLLGAALVGVELVARRAPARFATVGVTARWILQRRSARVAILVFWWWVGWHFLIER